MTTATSLKLDRNVKRLLNLELNLKKLEELKKEKQTNWVLDVTNRLKEENFDLIEDFKYVKIELDKVTKEITLESYKSMNYQELLFLYTLLTLKKEKLKLSKDEVCRFEDHIEQCKKSLKEIMNEKVCCFDELELDVDIVTIKFLKRFINPEDIVFNLEFPSIDLISSKQKVI